MSELYLDSEHLQNLFVRVSVRATGSSREETSLSEGLF